MDIGADSRGAEALRCPSERLATADSLEDREEAPRPVVISPSQKGNTQQASVPGAVASLTGRACGE